MDTISLENLHRTVETGIPAGHLVIDVREPAEYAAGHIPGSRNFPLSGISRSVEEIRKYEKIYIHCQAGGRASTAAQFLIGQGVTQLVCVSSGGFGSWKASGYPVETGGPRG